ncbi:MAG TPA: Mur ligase family protein [Oligoflexia bacterium]|nr:Mur ligase family protein [Oligoflexia bacterium]
MKSFAGKKIHVIGCAGTLMGSFCAFLKRAGVEVTGSDQNIYPPMSDVLAAAKVPVFTPYAVANLEKAAPDLVIVGNVVRKDNVEMVAALERGLPYLSLPSALEKMILPEKHSVVVAGTHGKTTTASLMAWCLEQCGEDPSFFVGGVLQNFPESFRVHPSKFMVLEGDEYDTAFFDKVPKFTHYSPRDVILTSIEYDHADIYPNIGSVIEAFDRLAALVPPSGNMVVCGESEVTLRVAHRSRGIVTSYGFGDAVDSRCSNLELGPTGSKFLWSFGDEEHRLNFSMTGRHNVLNAAGVLTLCRLLDMPMDKVFSALETFKGIKRRQEVYGVVKNITLIDDFAHHPTAVRETLSALRARHPKARLVACFEPRSATSRKKVFQQAYSESFDSADLVYIAKPYNATAAAPSPDTFSSEELLADLKERGRRAKQLETSATGVKQFASDLRAGDVVVVMSNGGFDGLLPNLLSELGK